MMTASSKSKVDIDEPVVFESGEGDNGPSAVAF
jgi:hypothetical protein